MEEPKSRFQRPTSDEQDILEHLVVSLVPAEEYARFDKLLVEHHYLHSAWIVGENMRYVATYKGAWMGLAAWSAGSRHLKARDSFIGWSDEQRRRRLALVVNNARGVELVSAFSLESGRWLGTVCTESKSNEIPAGREVLKKIDVAGKTVVADALHTQQETARQILVEGGGDYVLTVKGNQKGLQETIDGLLAEQPFPPS